MNFTTEAHCRLKLDFLKRLILGTVDEDIANNFFLTKRYPSQKIMQDIINATMSENLVEGRIWPQNYAFTMIGLKRLNNLHDCLDHIRLENIPGDLLEAGVWRGGACIFMQAYVKMYHLDKKVFVVDSFEGVPPPNPDKYPIDKDIRLDMEASYLGVPIEVVKSNFAKFDLLQNNVVFIKGLFKDSLPSNTDINNLCLLRADGDLYESTINILENLYPKLNNNGFCIMDDYYGIKACQLATDDYRSKNLIKNPLVPVDAITAFWHKQDIKESPVTFDVAKLQQAVQNAVDDNSRINVDILSWSGMSSKSFRHLLNNFGSLGKLTYLECGCFSGSTSCSLLSNNSDVTAILVDNFSQFTQLTQRHPAEILRQRLQDYANNNYRIIETDFFSFDCSKLPIVDIFFYDGHHSYENQYQALWHAFPCLNRQFLYIVDDYEWPSVKSGVHDSISHLTKQGKIKKLWHVELRSNLLPNHAWWGDGHTNASDKWYNGTYIGLFEKL